MKLFFSLSALLVAIASFTPAVSARLTKNDYYYNTLSHHRSCAPALVQHSLNTNQRWKYKQWLEDHRWQDMGLREWINAKHEFLEKQKEERRAYEAQTSTLCTIRSPR